MSISATEAVDQHDQPRSPRGRRPTSASTEDKQMFLELMVAQLRYQDPLNPADSGEFLAQSAQFTALEKMQDVSDRVGALLGLADGVRRRRDGRPAASPGSTPTGSPPTPASSPA